MILTTISQSYHKFKTAITKTRKCCFNCFYFENLQVFQRPKRLKKSQLNKKRKSQSSLKVLGRNKTDRSAAAICLGVKLSKTKEKRNKEDIYSHNCSPGVMRVVTKCDAFVTLSAPLNKCWHSVVLVTLRSLWCAKSLIIHEPKMSQYICPLLISKL